MNIFKKGFDFNDEMGCKRLTMDKGTQGVYDSRESDYNYHRARDGSLAENLLRISE